MKTYIKEILAKRKKLPENEYSFYSDEICKKIIGLKEFKETKKVLLFYPYLGEVNILPVAKQALKDGKEIYFPIVTGETDMEFVKVNDFNEFKEGYKGIKEPIGTVIFQKEESEDKPVMILPGSVFDLWGNRCGYGKGYYDRYLSECYDNIVKIGVCFSLQMMDEIPDVKPTDIPMDYVINEERIIIRSVKIDGNVK